METGKRGMEVREDKLGEEERKEETRKEG